MTNREYEEAFRSLNARVLATVARLVNAPRAVIEDAVGFAWEQAWRYREQLVAEPRLFRPWLVRVAQREAWRLYAEQEASAVANISEGEPVAAPRDQFTAREDRLEALQLIADMTPHQRPILVLWAAGYTYDEIAEVLGVSYTNVNRTLQKAKARLRRER